MYRFSIVSLLFCLILWSCKQSQTQKKQQNTDPKNNNSISELFLEAAKLDSVYYDAEHTEFVFEAGYLFNDSEKNAILLTNTSDTTYTIKLYTQDNNRWIENDSVENLKRTIALDINYEDYDFDGQKDIYIKVSTSNGLPMSRGHLLTVNPTTKKLTEHIEIRELANLKPDKENKVVYSEFVIWHKDNGMPNICTSTNKWVNGKLTTIKTTCPSESK